MCFGIQAIKVINVIKVIRGKKKGGKLKDVLAKFEDNRKIFWYVLRFYPCELILMAGEGSQLDTSSGANSAAVLLLQTSLTSLSDCSTELHQHHCHHNCNLQ